MFSQTNLPEKSAFSLYEFSKFTQDIIHYPETLTYDNNGNLTQTTKNGETTTYQWDCFDRMTKVTLPPQNGAEAGEEVSFTYDGEDQMVKIDYPDMSIDLKQMNGDIIRRVAKLF